MAKSRQAVNRGVRSTTNEEDYFKAVDLAAALCRWRTADPSLYALARAKIREIYPGDVATSALEAADDVAGSDLAESISGEFWFLCGDFPAFRNGLPRCANQLDILAASNENQIFLFVATRDIRFALRWCRRFESDGDEGRLHPIECRNDDLLMMPSMLFRIDNNDKMDLFGVSDYGFVSLSNQEASRLRSIITNKYLAAGDDLDGVDAQ